MIYLLVAVICVLVAFWIITPLLRPTPSTPVPRAAGHKAPHLEALHGRRDSLLRSLKELEFDRSMGKIDEDEYAAQRVELTSQTSQILDQIEGRAAQPAPKFMLTETHGHAAVTSSAIDAEIELEVLVARMRRQAVQPQTVQHIS